ncbi:MAG: class I SAM-dependent methyltransferase [Chromatiales bacterium]
MNAALEETISDMLKQGMIRLYIFWLYIPLRRLAHAFRDSSRRLRATLGLRPSQPPSMLPSLPWRSLCGSSGTTFKELKKVDGNVDLAELAVLNALCRTLKPKNIVEIGTFDGRTTLNLALNSNAQVLTLDLPCNAETVFQVTAADEKYVNKPLPGARFSSPPNNSLPCVGRITQLYGDSGAFDFSPWYGKIDFVFLDGAHSYEYVASDTNIALRLRRPESGIIVWHDYGVWPDVTRVLHELRKRMPWLPLVHIRDTSLVVLGQGQFRGDCIRASG